MGVPPINPPYIFDPDPPDEESGVARDKVFTWSILDPDGDLSWWKIWIDEGEGEQLVVDSTEEEPGPYSPYDGGSSAVVPVFGDPDDGVSVTIEKTSDWPSLTEITVHVEAEDDLANSLDTSWSVTIEEYETGDADPPYVQNEDPVPGATGVAADAEVYHEVIDDAGNLAPLSVEIYINGTLAWALGAPLSGFAASAQEVSNGEGYTVRPVLPFEAGEQTVRSKGEDVDGNAYDESWSFTTSPLFVDTSDTSAAGPAAEISDQNFGLDLLLNSHDIKVQNDDLVLVTGVNEVAQHLGVGLRLFLGEWYLDEDAGIPYYRHVFIAAPNSRIIEGLFRQDILGDPDIEAITEFDMEIDRTRRQLDLYFTAISTIGEVVVSAVFP